MPTVKIAYYSAMGRYWFEQFKITGSKHDEDLVIFYLDAIVKAIAEYVENSVETKSRLG